MSALIADVQSAYQTYAPDPSGLHEENYVVDELHYVNTLAGKIVICTIGGPFFGHGIIVKTANDENPDNWVIMESNEYLVAGPNIDKTEECFHKSGVFNFLIILKPAYIGNVAVTYHAYGGHVDYREFLSLKGSVDQAIEALAAGNIPGGPFARQGFSFYTSGYAIAGLTLGEIVISHPSTLTNCVINIGEFAKDASLNNVTMTFTVKVRRNGSTSNIQTFTLTAATRQQAFEFTTPYDLQALDLLSIECTTCGVGPNEGGNNIAITLWHTPIEES